MSDLASKDLIYLPTKVSWKMPEENKDAQTQTAPLFEVHLQTDPRKESPWN